MTHIFFYFFCSRLTVSIPKLNKGEYFKDLSLLTSLIASPEDLIGEPTSDAVECEDVTFERNEDEDMEESEDENQNMV